jgi:hypothetical protein
MKYLFFCTLIILTCCTREKPQNDVINTSIDIFIENANGQNLLLKTTPGTINSDSLKLLYLVNGKMLNVYNADMSCPSNICNLTDSGSERIRIFPNDLESEEFPISYIRWKNGDLDTIKCHFIRKDSETGSSLSCDKVWFNDLLMYPNNSIKGFGRAFKIVK